MITPMTNYFSSAYDKYIDGGDDENTASDKALVDTLTYIPVFKHDSVLVCQKSYSYFEQLFSDESIMDLWNNCYGRVYPEKGYTSGITAFKAAAFTGTHIKKRCSKCYLH